MNLLTQQLPDAVEIDGVEYKIDTDFRSCLKTVLALDDPELTDTEKVTILVDNLYGIWPDNPQKAVELGIKFLSGGDKPEEPDEDPMRLFSFEKDGNFIFAAFQQTHGIDLEKVTDLHWWKFLALFMDLGSETAFCQLVAFRKRCKTGTATKEEMKEYVNNPDLFEVPEPDTRTLEEKIAEEEFMRLVKGNRE